MAAVQESWKYPGGGWKGMFDPKNLLKFLRQLFKKDGPVSITHYLDDRLVVFLQAETQLQAIGELIEALDLAHQLKDKERFRLAILDREKIVSTGIGLGVAIPHAKLPGYEQFFIAIGIQEGQGIEWNSLDGSQVHLIFMIGGPDNRQTEYLNILSRLTMAIKDSDR
ncbi:MAG: PTS sugar transporter subunit IIA, partial [Rhabdochlamydiaceae bacterium]